MSQPGPLNQSTAPADRAALSAFIRAAALDAGFDAVGIAPVTPSEHAAFYQAWIDAGMHGTMSYLAREDAVRARLDARDAWPTVRTAVVVNLHYDTDSNTDYPDDVGIIARWDPLESTCRHASLSIL